MKSYVRLWSYLGQFFLEWEIFPKKFVEKIETHILYSKPFVSEIRTLLERRIFGPRSDEVTGERRRLHNEELNDLYCSPNIVRVIKSSRLRWAGHVARMGEKRGVYRVLLGKPEGRRSMGRPRRRWVDNIRMDLQRGGMWVYGLDRAGPG